MVLWSKFIAQISSGSLLRRSLVLAGLFVGLATVWVSIVSLVLVTVVGRAFADRDSSGSSARAGGSPAAAGLSPEARRAPSANGPPASGKPNG